jgi:tetratricopeptide (TPR) repeat protein
VVWTLILEKVPFCVLAVVFSAIAYLAQSRSDAITPFQLSELPSRTAGAVVALAQYVWQTAWPARLAVVYPRAAPSPWMTVASAMFLVAVSALVLRLARARRYLVVGWLWFIVALLPVIGIVQIGSAMMADKFMYVPLIGLAIMAAWGIPGVLESWGARLRAPVLAGAASLALALCAAKSWDQLASWENSIALYTKALAVTENNFIVLGNLAAAYHAAGRLDEAMQYYQAAIRAEPRFEIGYANIGHLLLMTRNDCERATPYFIAALRLKPEYQKARSGLAYCQNRPPAAR